MANLTITNTFTAGSTAVASQVNQNFTDVKTWLNNRDNASDTWLNVKGATFEATTLLKGKGTSTNDSATTGYIGETQSSTAAGVSAGTSTQWVNITTISLTAGDWLVSGWADHTLNGATMTGGAGLALSAFTGNTTTDHTTGDNASDGAPPTSTYDTNCSIPAWRVSIASTATYYLKARFVYSAGTPKTSGRITAVRIR